MDSMAIVTTCKLILVSPNEISVLPLTAVCLPYSQHMPKLLCNLLLSQ